MKKEYDIQFYKTISKLLCNISFAGQYISHTLFVGTGVAGEVLIQMHCVYRAQAGHATKY